MAQVTERTIQQLMRVAQNPSELQEAVAQRVGGVELTARGRSPDRSASPSVASSPTALHAVGNGARLAPIFQLAVMLDLERCHCGLPLMG